MNARGLRVGIQLSVSAFLALCAVSAVPGPAAAHPHAWIDVWVEVRFDESGAVEALRQTWRFDPYYTAFAVEGLDGDGDGRPDPDKLAELLSVNLANLAEYRYFTEAAAGDDSAAFDKPDEAISAMRGDRLEMSFTLPLDKPLRPGGEGFRYRVYDPTYYIEMLHAEQAPAVHLVGAPEGCDYRIDPASPQPEAMGLAAAADQSQGATPALGASSLGALFAETVTVTCP